IRDLGIAFHLDVAEAVIGEAGMPGFLAAAFQGVGEILGAARASLGDEAFSVKQFTRGKTDRGPGLSAHGDLRPAGKILSKVVNVDSRRGLGGLYGMEHLHHPDGRLGLRDQVLRGIINDLNRFPALRGKSGLVPSWLLLARVVILSA